jgi:hypothetical protein
MTADVSFCIGAIIAGGICVLLFAVSLCRAGAAADRQIAALLGDGDMSKIGEDER